MGRRSRTALVMAAAILTVGGCNPRMGRALGWHKTWNLTVIDVRYGTSVLLHYPGYFAVLADAGPETAGKKIVSLLQRRGIKRLDAVILSHPHPDHYRGVLEIMRRVGVDRIYYHAAVAVPEEEKERWEEVRKEAARLGSSLRKTCGGETIGELDPFLGEFVPIPDGISDVNDASLAVRVVADGKVIWLPADIGPEVQGKLAARYEKKPGADLVVAPHHGGPLHPDFLRLTSTALFLISVGPNPYGMPAPATLSQLAGRCLRTDEEGDLDFEIDEEIWRVAEKLPPAVPPAKPTNAPVKKTTPTTKTTPPPAPAPTPAAAPAPAEAASVPDPNAPSPAPAPGSATPKPGDGTGPVKVLRIR